MALLYGLMILALLGVNTAAECESGWIPYKDELCIKAFSDLLTYDESKNFCSSHSTEISTASFVMVKESGLQDLLADYASDIYNSLWLGGKYDGTTTQYKWEDGETFSYTNWQDGYPRNSTDTACVELRPIQSKFGIRAEGKWADVNCQKRNQVICQRAFSSTLQDAVTEILRIRKQNSEFEEELKTAEIERTELRQQLEATQQRVVPLGSIYIEYYDQPSPAILWPDLSWQDISTTFAGLFFRTVGGESESWGVIQNECAPRITQMEFKWGSMVTPVNPVNISGNGWSGYGLAGKVGDFQTEEGLRYYTDGCEVRPQNQAIRIWKRVA